MSLTEQAVVRRRMQLVTRVENRHCFVSGGHEPKMFRTTGRGTGVPETEMQKKKELD